MNTYIVSYESMNRNLIISDDFVEANVTGTTIDIAYVITSFFYSDTPSGSVDFGVGLTESVGFEIRDYIPSGNSGTSGTTNTTIVLVIIGTVAAGCLAVFVILFTMRKYREI